MCAIYGDKSRWAGVGKARLSGSCQGQIINHHLVDGPGQGCLTILLGGTVTEKCGPQAQPLPWTVSKTLYLRVHALLPHRTGLVPKVFGKLVEVKIWVMLIPSAALGVECACPSACVGSLQIVQVPPTEPKIFG